MTDKINVLAITGTKSEYNIIYPLLCALNCDPAFNLHLAVSGAHLSERHGYTVDLIEKDGFQISDRIHSLASTDQPVQRCLAVSNLVAGLAQSISRLRPDILLVVGDREESIAIATVGNYCDILTCHIGGGDPVFGNSDDPIRTAVSKLVHAHFTTTENYAQNLLNSGEDSWRVFNIGTPGLDLVLEEPFKSKKYVLEELGLPEKEYVVVIKHPLSSEIFDSAMQMEVTLSALEDFCESSDMLAIVLQGNNDPGSYEMSTRMRVELSPRIVFQQTLPRKLFVNLMRHCKALVGNSSMGILEAPMYGLPVVNIGKRQQGRLNAGNVEFVNYDLDRIKQCLVKACFDEEYRKMVKGLANPYGDGRAAEKFMRYLKQIDLTDKNWVTKSCFFPQVPPSRY